MDQPSQEMVAGIPAPALRPFVDRYVGYRVTGSAGGLHRGLPSRHMTFIVSIGELIEVVHQSDPHQSPDMYGTVVSGLHATPALIKRRHIEEGVAIELTPRGSRAVLGMPAAALWNTSVELSVLSGDRELWERIQETPAWEQRFEACDTVLIRMLGPGFVASELSRTWEALVASAGQVPVADLAREIGYSRQQLTRRFTAEFGMGPKLAGRVLRFERARQSLDRVRSQGSLADIAVACGFYDQPHLNRDFAQFAGCSPTEWLEEEAPSFQDHHANTTEHE